MTVNYNRKKKDVHPDEARNWPKGAWESSHKFSDLAEKPIENRPYLDNEECFAIYKQRKLELLAEGILTEVEADRQAKIDLLSVIHPDVDLVNFRADNPDMLNKCCHLIFSLDLDRIANIYLVHGEAIDLFQLATSGDPDLNEEDDPEWGWEMNHPDEGFPCMNVSQDGCSWHVSGGKPKRCGAFPYFEQDIRLIDTCSYNFNPQGMRTGNCDRCGA